jgi:formylglycine-generating enzyme required for sulfatase activity
MLIPPPSSAAVEPVLVSISSGWFMMGSEIGQDNEKPVHQVYLDAFSLAATQVTNAEYAVYVRESGAASPQFFEHADFNHPRQPVVSISWFEASHYCEWLSRATGRTYRLPTEAEWEYAARGGCEGKLFPWGDESPHALPGYHSRWRKGPEPVGQLSPNGYGLYDICLNVHEWCSDWYAADYYSHSPTYNPRGPEQGERKASRGGSWRHHIKATRCAGRSSIPPEFRYADYGFRLACTEGASGGTHVPG